MKCYACDEEGAIFDHPQGKLCVDCYDDYIAECEYKGEMVVDMNEED